MNPKNARASAIIGVVLILLGIFFFIGQFTPIDYGAAWPIFVVGVGVLFFAGMVAGGPAAGGLAIPGSIITMVGLILLVQNILHAWESWSYAWALILVAVGVGTAIQGYWSGRVDLRQRGWRLALNGLTLFLFFGVFFELVVYRTNTVLGKVFWPLALILAGVYLIATRLGWRARTPTMLRPGEPGEGEPRESEPPVPPDQKP